MNKSLPIVAFLTALLVFGNPASAVDIENGDDTMYEVTVLAGGQSESFSMSAGTKEENVCEERCTVQVEGVGSIEAGEQDVVVIRNGALTKRQKAL